jgi:hypothetical protein
MNNPYPTGIASTQRIQVKLAEMAVENARRVPCALCKLQILPEDMSRHVAICHGDEG